MKSKRPHYYGAYLSTFEKAKRLRKESTAAEKLFWKILRNRKIRQFKFRRQHPIFHYIADFYCHEAKLVIELDGSIHELAEIKQHDAERESDLKALGLTVIRFTNEEIFTETDKVTCILEQFLKAIKRQE